MKNVNIITIESDFGAGKKGAKLGPQALLKELSSSLINSIPVHVVDNTELVEDYSSEFGLHIDAIIETQKRSIQIIEEVVKNGGTPWIISGDHSNGLSAISAYKNSFPENKLGVIWIDAHADLHTPYTSPSGNVHGMPLGAALGLAEPKHPRNKVEKSIQSKWKELLLLGDKNVSPKVESSDLVFIDLRDLEEEEINLLGELSIKYFTPLTRKELGLKKIIEETISHLSNCNHILVSFDVDSLDPSISYGTGTPVPDGLSKDQAIELLSELLQLPNLFGFETTEINPLLDRHNPMEIAVAEIIEKSFINSGFLN
ncbi:MAG: arginase [Bacteroidia bacterium]|nr:arginase [Bacteroidia bacterium]MCF8445882.1 arginase [Bacteroidia bacterium]